MADDPQTEIQSELRTLVASVEIDPRRYRKLRRFVFRVLVHAFWFEVVLNRPLLRRLRSPAIQRWSRIVRRYRQLAVEMGGVLIKLGQFLSARVDVLPLEITRELADLQDEVPPDSFDAIVASIEADLGAPLAELFESLRREPLGAASLAQVHEARLAGGRPVVVKVLRPRIEVLVETDLAALGVAARWLRHAKVIRRRVDLKRLMREFAATTRRELDLEAEAKSCERFGAAFADDPQVRVPEIHWQRTGRRTLTMENVAFIKIGDQEALRAAGVGRAELATKLYQVYMEQIFVHNFVHADPHPGNIFVRSPSGLAEAADDAEQEAPRFEIVFVDFGMMSEVPERLREALREYVIALGTRDAHRMVQAYRDAGFLLPGADLKRLEEIHEDLFDRLWGVSMGDMREVAMGEAKYFLAEYWDVLSEVPFQVQTDLLFVGRAFGLLAGMATSIDPQFDPWAETMPFARRLAAGELRPDAGLFREVVEQGQRLLRLPARADGFFTSAQRGDLVLKASLAPDAERALGRLHGALQRLVWTVIAAALLVAGAVLYVGRSDSAWGGALMAAAGAAFLFSRTRRG